MLYKLVCKQFKIRGDNLKINNLKINGFGKLENKEINLSENINLIYGKNEAGKTTLLKFISGMFYGISKNKNKKEIPDYEKYKPWKAEEYSGKIEYVLDNKETFEVFRDFNKKNPKIYKNSEDISNEFNINKTKGNEFFYEHHWEIALASATPATSRRQTMTKKRLSRMFSTPAMQR